MKWKIKEPKLPKDFSVWHTWFAWFPVKINGYRYWLEKVERKLTTDSISVGGERCVFYVPEYRLCAKNV